MTITCPVCKKKTAVRTDTLLSGAANDSPIIETTVYQCPVCYWVKRDVKNVGDGNVH